MGHRQAKIGEGPVVKALKALSKALETAVKLAGSAANPVTTTTTTTV